MKPVRTRVGPFCNNIKVVVDRNRFQLSHSSAISVVTHFFDTPVFQLWNLNITRIIYERISVLATLITFVASRYG